MIVFLTTAEHAYTHQEVVEHASDIKVRLGSYETLFTRKSMPRATYVFTDLDRLSFPHLRLAADVYRCLRAAGVTVHNDPLQFRSRYGLLRALFRIGLNSFDAYRVEEGIRPERWPVFVRSEGDHEQPVSDLLHDWDAVRRAIDAAVAAGRPLSSLIVVEYAAEPVRPGLFRKLSSFRVGDSRFAHTCVHDETWLVKYGKIGCATPELYEDDLRIVRDNPFAAAIDGAFEVSGVSYGRADFGLVGDRVQVYEVNTNPDVHFAREHPVAARREAYAVYRANYMAALRAIDTPESSDRIEVTSPGLEFLRRQQKRRGSQRRG